MAVEWKVLVPLTVHGANTHGPIVLADFCELRDVGGDGSIVVFLAGKVDFCQLLAKVLEIVSKTHLAVMFKIKVAIVIGKRLPEFSVNFYSGNDLSGTFFP